MAFEYPRVGKNPSPELLKLIEETREMHPDMPDPEIRNDMDSIGEVLRGFFLAQDQETFTVSEALGALKMDKEEFAQLYKKLRPTLSMLLWNDAAGHPMSEQALNALPGKIANVIREMRTNPAYIQRKNELEKFLMASSNPPVILAVDSTPNPGGEHDRILAILSF